MTGMPVYSDLDAGDQMKNGQHVRAAGLVLTASDRLFAGLSLVRTQGDCDLIKQCEFSKTSQHNDPLVDLGDQREGRAHTHHLKPGARTAGLQDDLLF